MMIERWQERNEANEKLLSEEVLQTGTKTQLSMPLHGAHNDIEPYNNEFM